MIYDVIVVGAGPGGSSAATFLARQGLSVLLLDKASFPREKVCGDGLTPQAVYWLDLLGCVEQILDQTDSCITSADLYVNGQHVLTGSFPQDTLYPGFCTLLERRKLDHTLVRHAVSQGAVFKPRHHVRKIHRFEDGVAVDAESARGTAAFKGRLLIGADGGNSIVSRSLGNVLRDGTTAICLRGYYEGVKVDRSQFKIFFDEKFFPGYGWVFVDDSGKANIGLGYAADKNFPLKVDLKRVFSEFVRSDLQAMLKQARPMGRPAGGWACFSRPKTVAADRVMLIGDAANLADPMNGGGIHNAMESAFMASQVAAQALSSDDCSAQALSLYENLWKARAELEWRTGELFLSFAKNPNLRELYLFFLKAVGRLSEGDPRFQDFCTSFFMGVTPRSASVAPAALLDAVPLDPRAWLSIVGTSQEAGSAAPTELAISAARGALRMAGRVVTRPLENIYWGLEMLEKLVGLAGCYVDRGLATII